MCHVTPSATRSRRPGHGGILALLVFGAALAGCKGGQEASAPPALRAERVPGAGPMLSLEAADWDGIAPTTIPLIPQVAVAPTNPEPAASSVRVRLRRNDDHIAILLEWNDATESDALVVDQFGDQVAIQYPVDHATPPSATMGSAGQPVAILQWRSPHARDRVAGDPSIPDLFPNAHVDYYTTDQLPEEQARPYTGAVGLHNPVSRGPDNGVLLHIAEGYGSLTAVPSEVVHAQGAWADGVWRVVISHALDGADGFLRLSPGSSTVIAFAVWDGGNREVGSRKAWAAWVPLTIEGA